MKLRFCIRGGVSGGESALKARHTDSSQDVKGTCVSFADDGKGINRKSLKIADGETVTWERVWLGLC